jgi:hypothetical protein
MSKSITITLREPIQAHGETLTQLVLEAPRAKHLRHMPVKSVMEMGDILDLAGTCLGLPPSSMDQLCAADAMKLVEAIGGFLGSDIGAKPLS